MNDDLTYQIRRVANYNNRPLSQEERELLLNAASELDSPSAVLAEAVPHLSTLAHLLEVVTDPKKSARAVQQLHALVDEANAARSSASMAIAELDKKSVEIEPKLAAAKEEHAAKLAEAQAAFDKRVSEFQKQLSVRQAAVADLEKAAKADADAAAELRADLAARLERVRSAAA